MREFSWSAPGCSRAVRRWHPGLSLESGLGKLRALSVLLALAAAILFPSSGSAQSAAEPFAPLDAVVAEEMRSSGTPGAAIAIVVGDQVVFAHGYGVQSIETGNPVDADTLFRVGSTTKMLTGAAVAAAADRGLLDLQAPLRRYVEGLPPGLREATVHQLLTHTAGVRDESSYFGNHDDAELGRFIRTWTPDMQIAPAGDVYSYSNPGYGLAGYVLERATGQYYADAMRTYLFTPLGMVRSTLRPLEAVTYPFALGHEAASGGPRVVRPFADNARYWPNGSVFTSANEFARFAIALLNGGRLDGRQALSAAVVEAMQQGYVETPGVPPGAYSYGLNVRTSGGRRVLQHGGERIGFGSLVRFIPERRIAVIVLGNLTGPSLIRSFETATELALRLPDNSGSPPELPPTPSPPSGNVSAAVIPPIEQLAGRYVNKPGELELELLGQDGQVVLRGNAGGQPVPVERLPDGRYKAGDQTFLFVRGGRSGRIYLFIAGRAFRREESTR